MEASRKYQRIRRLYRPFIGHYVALSKDLEQYLGRDVGVESARIAQIYNGVDTVRFLACPQRAGTNRRLSSSPTRISGLVGPVGRLQQVKDQVTLAEAFVRAIKRGTGQDSDAARHDRRWTAQGRASKRCSIRPGCGNLPGCRGARRRAGNSARSRLLRAPVAGGRNIQYDSRGHGVRAAVVATRVGGNPELIEEGVTGRLVPQANAEAMAAALFHYYDDPALARRHGRAGRQADPAAFQASTVWSPTTYRFMMASFAGRKDRAAYARVHG
jgi:hypothetical protein